MSVSDVKYYMGMITQELVGWKITSGMFDLDNDDDDRPGYYGFIVRKGKLEKNIWVMRDEEGNGPGVLLIETPIPEFKRTK
ncbi:MAG: hypothetical protein ACLQVJ_26265 [Syntrophobacteraceae bacterium]